MSVSPIEGGPEQLVILVVLRNGYKRSSQELKVKFSKAIQSNLNPLFKVALYANLIFFPVFFANKGCRKFEL